MGNESMVEQPPEWFRWLLLHESSFYDAISVLNEQR